MLSSTLIQPPAVAEYLLLIEPRKDLCDAIIAEKQLFCEKFKTPDALNSKPHLTLVSYKQYTSFESRIQQRLRTVFIQTAPFSIELQDFGSFPSHTIYINVATKNHFHNLVKKVRTHLQDIMKMDKDNKPHFILEPHITVARRLKPWQYEQGWLALSHKKFSGKFIATNITLLKKEIGEDRFKLLEKFELENIPINATQALLF